MHVAYHFGHMALLVLNLSLMALSYVVILCDANVYYWYRLCYLVSLRDSAVTTLECLWAAAKW